MNAAVQPAEPALAIERIRRGGRAGKRAGGGAAFEQPPFRQLRNPLTPTKLVSEDELESIHLASLRVLKEIGVDVLHDEARRVMSGIFRRNGNAPRWQNQPIGTPEQVAEKLAPFLCIGEPFYGDVFLQPVNRTVTSTGTYCLCIPLGIA